MSPNIFKERMISALFTHQQLLQLSPNQILLMFLGIILLSLPLSSCLFFCSECHDRAECLATLFLRRRISIVCWYFLNVSTRSLPSFDVQNGSVDVVHLITPSVFLCLNSQIFSIKQILLHYNFLFYCLKIFKCFISERK